MLTKPTIVFIGAACGLVFLLVSIHNSRSLNNQLMEKLVETEEEFKTAADNHETCGRTLEEKNSDLEEVSRERDQLDNELQSLREEKSNLDNLVLELENNLDTLRTEKDHVLLEKEEFVSENERLQQVIVEKTELVEHLEMTNTNLMSDAEEARAQLSTQQKKLEEIKNSVISGGEEQSQVDEAVDQVYDDQGQLKEDIEVNAPPFLIEFNDNEEKEDVDEEEDNGEEMGEEDENEEEEMDDEEDDYPTSEALEENEEGQDYEEIAEEQEYDASSVEYEDANASSISSSFAAYTDEEMNQKSQR